MNLLFRVRVWLKRLLGRPVRLADPEIAALIADHHQGRCISIPLHIHSDDAEAVRRGILQAFDGADGGVVGDEIIPAIDRWARPDGEALRDQIVDDIERRAYYLGDWANQPRDPRKIRGNE